VVVKVVASSKRLTPPAVGAFSLLQFGNVNWHNKKKSKKEQIIGERPVSVGVS
jgi:hypothetical protein